MPRKFHPTGGTLLIILLPLGLWGAYQLTSEEPIEDDPNQPATVDELVKLIEEIQQPPPPLPTPTPMPQFEISNVSYASDSGSLKITGKAPDSQVSVMVSSTVLPLEQSTPKNQDDDSVLGYAVSTRSIFPSQNQSFNYAFSIPKNAGVVQLRFEQNGIVNTLIYDVTYDQHTLK